MNLSQEQIADLFSFVKRKYVPYYDLQIELVDHLATSIEQKMTVNPSISFESALRETYKGFGITGFSQYRCSKEKELSNYWLKRIGRYSWRFITPPKVIMTIALTMCFYYFNLYVLPLLGLYLIIIIGLISFLTVIKLLCNQRLFQWTKTGKNLLSVSTYLSVVPWSLYIFYYLSFFGMKSVFLAETPILFNLVFTSILSALTIMMTHAVLVVFPKELESEVMSQYPEYYLA